MKKYKQLVGGIVIGAMIATGGTAFANSSVAPVITNWVKFKFNGEAKNLPSGYTVINYEGHTYVPARFIAEELGADVKWDVNSNTVLIDEQEVKQPTTSEETPSQPEKPDVNNEETQSQDETKETPSTTFEELPVSKTLNGVSVEIYEIDQSDYENTMLYFRVKNTNDSPMQFIQSSGYLEADGKKYEHTGVNSNTTGWKDSTWFTDLNEDDDNEGYIMIKKVPNDIKEGTVHVEVLQNDRTQKITTYEFDIKWD